MSNITVAEFINKVGFKVNKDDVQKVNDSISSIKSTATKILGAIGIGFSLTSMNEIIEEFTRVNNQIKNSTEGLGDQNKIQQDILNAATATRSEYATTARVVSDLVHENKELFSNVDEAIKFNNAATMLFKTAGKTNEEIAGLMEAINKSFAKGYIDSETLSQLLEQSPEAVELLNKQLGTTSDQLEQLASDGQFTVRDLKDAFVNNAAEIEDKFGQVKMTITEGLTVIKNKWGLWLTETNDMFGITDKIAKVMVQGFDKVLKIITKLRTGFMKLSEKIGGTEKMIKLITIAAGGLFLAFNADKIIAFLTSMKGLLTASNAKLVLIAAAFVAIGLTIEDIIVFMQGGDSLFGTMLEKAGIDAEKVRSSLQRFLDTVKKIVPAIKKFASGIGKELFASLSKIMPMLAETGKKILPTLVSLIRTVASFIKDIGASILPLILSAIEQLAPLLTSIAEAVIPVVLEALEQIIPVVSEIIEAILPVILEILQQIAPIISELVSTLLPVLIDIFNQIGPILMNIIEAVLPVILDLLEAFMPILEPIFDMVKQLVESLLPPIAGILKSLLPILEPILGILEPIASVIGSIVSAIGTVVGWIGNGLGWVVDKFFGGGDIDQEAVDAIHGIEGNATGTESTSDTFIAGEEGAEIITGQPGKKVFTALESGRILNNAMRVIDAMRTISSAAVVSPVTAGSATSETVNKSIIQNIEINNKFEGDKAGQQKSSSAMNKAADDLTSVLARGLAYSR